MTRLKDSNGAATLWTYDFFGNVSKIKNPDGTETLFTYDKLGRLLKQTDALGNATAFTYDAFGNVLTQTDALGNTTSYVYDAAGRLLSETNALGAVVSYAYDALGRTVSVTRTSADGLNSTAQTTAYAIQAINGEKYQIVATTDSANNQTVNRYDLAGNLVQATDAAGSSTFYAYDSEGRLLTVADALNRTVSYAYDVFGNVSSITQADGSVWLYSSNAAGQILSETDPLGTVVSYACNLNGQVTETKVRDKALPGALGVWLETARTFDGVDDSVTIPNASELNIAGEITLSAWVKVENANGLQGIVEHGYYGGSEVFLRIGRGKYQVGSYDGSNHFAEAPVDSADIGAWVHLIGTYDGANWNLYKNGELVASAASAIGALAVDCDWRVGAAQSPGRFFKGDVRGVGVWDSALSASEAAMLYEQGFSVEITQSAATYDAVGNLLTQTDAMGNATSYVYDAMGRVAAMTDALNNVTRYAYDKAGRLVTTTDACGTVTRNFYDAVGNLLETRRYDGTVFPAPLDSRLSDGQDFNGADDTVNIGNDSSLNFEGEITVSARVKIDSTGGFKTIVGHGNAGGKEVFLRLSGNYYQFGSWESAKGNRLVSAAVPESDFGSWVSLVGTYDGKSWNLYRNGELLASRADSTGSVTVNADWHVGSSNGNARFFDGEIRDVAIWNVGLDATQVARLYAGDEPAADYAAVSTRYSYDSLGRLLSLTDSVGNTTIYEYDFRGLVLSETNEKNAARTYVYDSLGRLVQKTDRNQRKTAYTYDAVGRLTSESWLSEENTPVKTFSYAYDAVGSLLTAADGSHSYVYSYDSMNRIQNLSFIFDSQTAAFSYAYDAAGRQTQSSLRLNGALDRVNQTAYDFLGNATQIKQTRTAVDEIFAEFDCNANGLLTSVRRFEKDGGNVLNEIAQSLYEYNANNAVASITHKKPDGTQIVKHSYSYDETTNIVEYLNSLDGRTSYDYDFLGQLIGANYANQNLTDETCSYDANGSNYSTGQNNELTSDGQRKRDEPKPQGGVYNKNS